MFGSFTTLTSVFRKIIQHAPEVNQSTPVYIAKVHEQEVVLEVVDETIITRQEQVSKISPMRIASNATACMFVIKVHQFSGEQITTVDMLFTMRSTTLTCACVFPVRWRTVSMRDVMIMSLATLDKCNKEMLQAGRVRRCLLPGRFLPFEDILQLRQEIDRLGLCATRHLHVIYHERV